MKGFSLIVLICFLCCNSLFTQIISSSILFDQPVFDFGDIFENHGVVSHSFVFSNVGKTSVKIDEVISGCGCTSHEFLSTAINPGQKSQITISYNPRHRPGSFSKEIVVLSNNKTHINRVWIKGNVISQEKPVEEDHPYEIGNGLYLSLKVLAFGKVEFGKSHQIKLLYANSTEKPMTLSFFVEGNQKIITFQNPGNLSPKQRGEMIFSYNANHKFKGVLQFNIFPVVNGQKLLQPIEVKITGTE